MVEVIDTVSERTFEATVDYRQPLGDMIAALRYLGVEVDKKIASHNPPEPKVASANILVRVLCFGKERTVINESGPGGAHGRIRDFGLSPLSIQEMLSWILCNHEELKSLRPGGFSVVALGTRYSDGSGWPQWARLYINEGILVVRLSHAGGESGTEFSGAARFGGFKPI